MAITDPIIFFAAQTTDGNSTAYKATFPNRRGQLSVYGTFNGATVTLTYSPDGGTTYVTLKDVLGNDVAATAARPFIIEVPVGVLLRATQSSSGGSTSLNAKLLVL